MAAEHNGSPRGRVLVAKVGLDGHDRGVKVVARMLRDAGFEVIYLGLRQTPESVAAAAADEDVDVVGLSMHSGGHLTLAPAVVEALRGRGLDIPVLVGGIVPAHDVPLLHEHGIDTVLAPGASEIEVVAAVEARDGGALRAGQRVPLVGVTTYYGEAAWNAWHRMAAVLAIEYFELLAAEGCRPVLLPPCRDDGHGGRQGASDVMGVLDALVLVGGGDVDPASYDGGTHPGVDGVDVVRDASERALLAAALDADLPVLAICRGMQVLNVELGGTLTLHLPDLTGDDDHRPGPGAYSAVEVETVAGTVARDIFGPTTTVSCSHHQAIDRLGAGLIVSARSRERPGSKQPDGVVEAVELPDRRFVVGVQSHPEHLRDGRPFAALAAAARAG